MRKLIVSEFLTLDGVMQAPGDPNEDRSGGFDQGGWQLPFFDDVFGRTVMETFAAADALLLGRRTYEIFAAHWPNQPAEDPLAGTMNSFKKHVVSTTLREPLAWQKSTRIDGDVAGEIARVKDQPGKDILVIGSGELVKELNRHDLVDEYRLMIHPIVLGMGKRLFVEGGIPQRFRLTDSKPTTTGVLMLWYEPVATGTATTAPVAAAAGSTR